MSNGNGIETGGESLASRLRKKPPTVVHEPMVIPPEDGLLPIEEEVETRGESPPPARRGRAPAKVKAAPKKTEGSVAIQILPPRPMSLLLRLVGESPLVVHAFSEKGKQEMRDKQQGKTRGAREAKDPIAEYNGARYRVRCGEGKKMVMADAFPAMTIKKGLISACRMLEGIPMTLVRQTIFVNRSQELIQIEREPGVPYHGDHGSKFAPVMREDIVRVGGRAGPGSGTADLRYRPQYEPWSIPVIVTFLPNLISAEQVLNLFAYAGFGCGIGENRAEKTGGSWGLFRIEDDQGNRIEASADAE